MGEIAALLTSVCWAGSSIAFSKAGKKVGSVVVNRVRLLLAVLLLMFSNLITQGELFPLHVEGARWLWLGLSGLVGFVIGDAFLLQAYVMVGPRISMLLMSTVPIFSALLAWTFLGEILSAAEIIGILITVGGIAIVILDRKNGGQDKKEIRKYVLGILCGLGGALGQAVGLILAKKGLVNDFPAITGVLMRASVAMLVMWLLAIVSNQLRSTLAAIKNPETLKPIAAGSFIGPFIGVWFSLISIQAAYVGIASTLMSLSPIILLPVSHFYLKEKVTRRAIYGTFITVIGITIIFVLS
jgi:drug/metabolite transporter (DMT)-like permease